MIRVLVVDDHPMFRQGVVTVLSAEDDLEVVGSAGSVKEARTAITELSPDVVLMDVRMPDGDGTDLCSELRDSGAKVIILSQYRADRIVLSAFRQGAKGYVVKESEPSVLRQAIRAVASGADFVDSQVAGKLVQAATKGPKTKGRFGLTPQELAVLELLPRKLTNRQIGQRLGISEETVRTHLRHTLRKLQVEDRGSAAALAVEIGLG